METLNTTWLIILLITLVIFYLVYAKGKKTFGQYITPLDKKEFPLKEFLPVGFQIMQWTGYKYGTQFDRQMRKKLKEIYPPEFGEFYLRVTWAGSCTDGVLGLLMGVMLSTALGGDPMGVAMGAGLGALMAYLNMKEVDKKSEEKHKRISMALPDLTNKIIILSGAGLTLRATLIKISKELDDGSLLYEELGHSIAMLENGSTAEDAFEHLNVRCNTPDMRRFVSVILQNMHRGGNDVIQVLQDIGREQWENRKTTAIRMAEEAGTKMLFPMMLMLFAVILLTIAPAIMGMNI